MLSPGAKGWINKYFELVDSGEISLHVRRPIGVRKLHFMHLTLGNCGIVFGYPIHLIFGRNLDDGKWTNEEKLKLLLFESHLFVYLQIHKEKEFNKDEFIHSLSEFYQYHNARAVSKLFKLFRKSDEVEMVEDVLAKRVDIKTNLIENKWWVNSLSNAFVYLDVILFDDFEHKEQKQALKGYSSYALNALTAITLSAYSDGVIEEKEKDLFNIFLASANLEEEQRDIAKERFRNGASLDDFSIYVQEHWLLKRFLLDMSALLIFSNHEALDSEIEFLDKLANHFDIPDIELEETMAMVENFVLKSKDKAMFLGNQANYEKVYFSITKRWTKVLVRNKDKIAVEIKESRELIALVTKSTHTDLTKEEKEAIREQLKDIAKSVPALTIFMLPGGTVLMPLLLKMLPDLVPSAFKENQLDAPKDEQEDKQE
jgi:hypothetical protein